MQTVPTIRTTMARGENGRTNLTRNPVLVSASNKHCYKGVKMLTHFHTPIP